MVVGATAKGAILLQSYENPKYRFKSRVPHLPINAQIPKVSCEVISAFWVISQIPGQRGPQPVVARRRRKLWQPQLLMRYDQGQEIRMRMYWWKESVLAWYSLFLRSSAMAAHSRCCLCYDFLVYVRLFIYCSQSLLTLSLESLE
jgi:hypothetical protein